MPGNSLDAWILSKTDSQLENRSIIDRKFFLRSFYEYLLTRLRRSSRCIKYKWNSFILKQRILDNNWTSLIYQKLIVVETKLIIFDSSRMYLLTKKNEYLWWWSSFNEIVWPNQLIDCFLLNSNFVLRQCIKTNFAWNNFKLSDTNVILTFSLGDLA